jgi:voltage-gated potassium channel
VLGITLLALCIAGGTLGYMFIEGWSILDSLYQTVTTITTVGFQEVRPLSGPGRAFTMLLIMAGLTTLLYTLTRIGQSVFEGELLEVLGRRSMKRDLADLRNHFIVCGYGKVGRPVAEGLTREGLPFCVIDNDDGAAPALRDDGFLHVIGDATEESVLDQAGVDRALTLLALLPSDADNLYLTIAAKDRNPAIKVIARAGDPAGEMRIKRAGADDVISPTRIAGLRVLQAAINPTALEFMEIVTRHEALQLSLADIRVSEGSELKGQSISEAGIRGRFGVIVVAVKSADGSMAFNPGSGHRIQAGDTLVVLGEDLDIVELQQACG